MSEVLRNVSQEELDEALKYGNLDFRECRFEHLVFERRLDCADFSASHFRDCRFHDCSIQNADFSYARIDDAMVRNVCLIGSNFYGAEIQYTNFHDCDMRKTRFMLADLKNLNLIGCDFSHSTLDCTVMNNVKCEAVKAESMRRPPTLRIELPGASAYTGYQHRRRIMQLFCPESAEAKAPELNLINAGYTITRYVVFENGWGFALGENTAAASKYVSWYLFERDGQFSYEWGRYGNDFHTILSNYEGRIKEYVQDYGVKVKHKGGQQTPIPEPPPTRKQKRDAPER